ncbi:MAG: HAMP domain-containing sensor histidine kinase [Bacteroidota bacterium]
MADKKTVSFSGKSLEERLFQLILLISIALAVLWLLYRLFYFKNMTMVAIHTTSSTTLTLLFLFYIKTRSFQLSALIFYLIIMIFIAFGFFPSGGIQGAGVIFSLIVYCSGLLVLPPRYFIFFSVIFITLLLSLFLLEYMFPELVTPPDVGKKMNLASILTTIVFFIVLGVVLYYFKKEYVNEFNSKHIQSERLSKEKEKLENAERYKTRFMKTIWSEMNAPIAGIEHTLEQLEETRYSDEQKKMMSRLRKNSELLKSILNDVIDLSRIGMGKATLRKIEFDLSEELNELIEILESGKDGKQTIFEFRKGSTVPSLLVGDPVRLKQSIISLINSSIRFMKGNEVMLSADLLLKSEKSCTLRFNINCKGAGLSKRTRAEIFEKFYNSEKLDLHNADTEIDLLLPKNLVETMGGSISFSFDENYDFIFYFDLPFGIPESASAK